MSKLALAAASVLSLASMASAQDSGDINFSAGLSLLGPILEGSYQITPDYAVRGIAFGGIDYSDVFDVDSYTVDGSVALNGGGLLLDYYPTSTGWRISGGVVFVDFSLDGDFVGPEDFIGNLTLNNEVAAVVTTGYRHTFGNNITISGDAGIMVDSFVASTNNTDPDVVSALDALNDDLAAVPVIPYLSITFGYTF